ncbi:MAG: hypothetical protein LH645_13070 [Actinomycetia bacterium]|nr:hypothetical protein [Actinomycetes bacterium]
MSSLAHIQDISGEMRKLLLVIVIGILAGRELGVLRFPLPQNKRLVPITVFRLGERFGPIQFGFEMGSGIRTYVTSSLPYLLVVATVLLASLPEALVAGGGFAIGRSAMAIQSVRVGDVLDWTGNFNDDAWLRPWLLGLTLAGLAGVLFST